MGERMAKSAWVGMVAVAAVLTVQNSGARAQGAATATAQGDRAIGTGGHATLRQVGYGQGTAPLAQDDLFAGTEKFAKGASDVTEVSMDPQTLGMVNGKDAPRAHNMVLNVVRTYEYDKPGMYRIEDVEEYRRKLDTGDWHCSIHTRDLKHGESTDICSKHRTDGLLEQAIITVEPKELTFIHTIRRPGGGASVVLPEVGGDLPAMGAELAMLGPTMDALRPEIEAEVKAGLAESYAHREERRRGLEALGRSMPKLQEQATRDAMRQLQEQMKQLQANPPHIDTGEIQRQLQELQDDSKQLKNTEPAEAPQQP